jgi:hypothetical protein
MPQARKSHPAAKGLDAVLITRERLQEVLDDAVRRGLLTTSAAAELLGALFGGPADRVRREVDRARRVAGLGPPFPIDGYEGLSAAQVQARLDQLSAPELRKVRDFERRNANRKTVLAAIEARLDRA